MVLLNPAGFFFCMSNGVAPADPALSYDQQIELLKSRGLAMPDEGFARHCLAHCNFYRLTAYRRTLVDAAGNFVAGTRFEDLWQVYVFDRSLRRLLLEALKQVEISVRAQWTYRMAMEGGPHAFEDAALFVQVWKGQAVNWHAKALADLDELLAISEDRRKHRAKEQSADGRPPIWACSETMSFGLLSRFFAATSPFRIRNGVAKCYDLHAEAMKSFLEHAAYVRNLAAHHISVWDRVMTVRMAVPIASPAALIPAFNPATDNRVYNTLVMLVHMIRMIDPQTDWPDRLRNLIVTASDGMRSQMGFPADWQKFPLWAAGNQMPAAGPVA